MRELGRVLLEIFVGSLIVFTLPLIVIAIGHALEKCS